MGDIERLQAAAAMRRPFPDRVADTEENRAAFVRLRVECAEIVRAGYSIEFP